MKAEVKKLLDEVFAEVEKELALESQVKIDITVYRPVPLNYIKLTFSVQEVL